MTEITWTIQSTFERVDGVGINVRAFLDRFQADYEVFIPGATSAEDYLEAVRSIVVQDDEYYIAPGAPSPLRDPLHLGAMIGYTETVVI